MKTSHLFLIVVISLLTSLIGVWLFAPEGGEVLQKTESVYDRVMRTGTIRCGYILYPPHLMRDPHTKKISGISHDIIEEVARSLNLKVEWVEEAGSATFITALENNRFDMLCNAAWLSAPRARIAGFSTPVYYTNVYAVARIGDDRFDYNLERINSADVTIADIDGSSYGRIARKYYPNAKITSYPELTDFSQPLIDLYTGKANVALSEKYKFESFNENNHGKLKIVPSDAPVEKIQNSFCFKGGEYRFIHMIDAVLTAMHLNGEIDKILSKYEKYPNSFERVRMN